MKKGFLLLPLSALLLSACSSHTPAPVVNAADSSELPPSVITPVMGTGATETSYGWQTDIQPTEMPPVMATPVYTPVPQPIYSAPEPTYSTPKPLPSEPKVSTNVTTVTKSTSTSTAYSQDFTIPRDENNAPIYSQIEKGFYKGDTYTVRKGDTMFLISYITGKEVKEIATMNNMSEPYQLLVGKVLKVGNGQAQQAVEKVSAVAKNVESEVTYTSAPNGTAYGSDGTVTGPVKAGTATAPIKSTAVTSVPTTIKATAATPSSSVKASSESQRPASSIKWQWPTEGKVVQGYSSAEGGNKGVDIAGAKGQAVKASAAGRVVYIGDQFQGFGNLVVIKHNEEFMSAYGHLDSYKVKAQDEVKAGQVIGTLGSTGTTSNRLHFEIRHDAKTLDPLLYLPKR